MEKLEQFRELGLSEKTLKALAKKGIHLIDQWAFWNVCMQKCCDSTYKKANTKGFTSYISTVVWYHTMYHCMFAMKGNQHSLIMFWGIPQYYEWKRLISVKCISFVLHSTAPEAVWRISRVFRSRRMVLNPSLHNSDGGSHHIKWVQLSLTGSLRLSCIHHFTYCLMALN